MIFWELNLKLFNFLNPKISHPVLNFLIFFLLIPLFSLLLIFPVIFTLKKKERRLGLFSLIFGWTMYFIGKYFLKPCFKIPRPYLLFPSVQIIGPWRPRSFSFPSTTTMLALGLALPIFLEKRTLGIFLLSLAFLVGFSVIYTGYHTPLDVLFAIFFDFLFFYLTLKIYKKRKNN